MSTVSKMIRDQVVAMLVAKTVEAVAEKIYVFFNEDTSNSPNPDLHKYLSNGRPPVSAPDQHLVLEEVAMHVCQFVETLGLLEDRRSKNLDAFSLDERNAAFHLASGVQDCLPHLAKPQQQMCQKMVSTIESSAGSPCTDVFWKVYQSLKAGGLTM